MLIFVVYRENHKFSTHSPIFLLASNNSGVVYIISFLVFPNMTMSSVYANIDSLYTISTIFLWVNCLMTFSKPILNSGWWSPCRSPELILNSNDSFPRNFTLHMVLALQSMNMSMYFFGSPKLIMAFYSSSLFILSYVCL